MVSGHDAAISASEGADTSEEMEEKSTAVQEPVRRPKKHSVSRVHDEEYEGEEECVVDSLTQRLW